MHQRRRVGSTRIGKSAGAPVTIVGAARATERYGSRARFFVFFPGRRHGSLRVNGDNTIAFTPEGGIEWLVTLDPQTSLPKTMMHKEGDRTITVAFTSYEKRWAPCGSRRKSIEQRAIRAWMP